MDDGASGGTIVLGLARYSRMEIVFVVFALLGVPGILVSYGLSGLVLCAVSGVLKALAN
jgi:hypothetical protein